MSNFPANAAAFLRRNEKKLLLVPVVLLPLAIALAFMRPKPEPMDFPPPMPPTAEPSASSGLAGPTFHKILGVYQGLEAKVYAGVGMPEADRAAFQKARDQIQLCNQGADAGTVALDACIAEHLHWLLDEATADLGGGAQ